MITNNNQQQPTTTAQQPNKVIQWILNFLVNWGHLTRALEATLIDNLAATVPWLAPAVPAYMIYYSLTYVIKFPQPVAIISAAVVEFLGLATVTTTFQFWDWNDSKRQGDPNAPVPVAAISAAFYLIVVITVNVILDLKAPLEQLIAKALLSTLSIIAAITLAIRSQHARRLALREQQEAQTAEIEKAHETQSSEQKAQQDQFELEKIRIAEASRVEIEKEKIRAMEARKTEVTVARIEAGTSRHVATNVANEATAPTFSRGYPGFVQYLSWLESQGRTFDKRVAAQEMGRSVRMIERYLVEGAGNGAGELLGRLSGLGNSASPTLE